MANWAAFESALARRFGGAVVADGGGFRFRSGLTSGFTNAVLRTTVDPDAVPVHAADVRAWFPRGSAWRWLVTALDRPTDLATRLFEGGFDRVGELPAMTLELATLRPARSVPVEVAEVTTSGDLDAWLSVRNANHPLDATTQRLWRSTHAGADHAQHRLFIARDRRGRPVGSSALFLDDAGRAGLYHVDVLPESRGQGIGTALTRVSLSAAIEAGATLAVLTATQLGVRLYRPLGFEIVGQVAVLAPR